MDIYFVLHVVGPVFLLLGLGYFAGRQKQFSGEQMRGLTTLVLRYAMPAALFLGMAHFDRELLLRQGPLVLIMLLFYSGFFVLGYTLLRAARQPAMDAALLSYAGTSKAATVYGLLVLTQLFGADLGRAMVGLSALIMNLTQLSLAIYLFKSAGTGEAPSILATLRKTLVDPLVIAPFLGAVIALSGFTLPAVISDIMEPLAETAGPVAIFAAGLAMATFRLHLGSRAVVLAVLNSLVVMPALFFVLLKLFGLSGPVPQAAFVVCLLPIASKALLFSETYEEEEGPVASILLITSLALFITIPLGIWLTGFL